MSGARGSRNYPVLYYFELVSVVAYNSITNSRNSGIYSHNNHKDTTLNFLNRLSISNSTHGLVHS